MPTTYDAIVIGARCAGSPTAMLLARKGYRVLMVDQASFPSDTISTHLIHPPGVDLLRSWGLLDRVVETGCPPIDTYAFDFGPFVISGTPGPAASPVSYAPRRTVLDALLVNAAADAGVEVREAFSVEEILVEDGRAIGVRGHGKEGGSVTERARVIVGADGRHSLVAKAFEPERYHEKPALQHSYYSYWSGLPMDGRFEAYDLGGRSFATWPTNDGLTLVIAGWPIAEFDAIRKDIEGSFRAVTEAAPRFAERIRGAKREDRFYGTSVPNYFRKPFGPGWALVGDAGYNKDFITAQGISDAFRDAERCATALDETFTERRSFDDAMGAYQAARDAHAVPIYEFTCQFAMLQPPPPQLQQVLGAAHGNREAMDGFVRIISGVVSPADYFSEENVGRIFAAATPR